MKALQPLVDQPVKKAPDGEADRRHMEYCVTRAGRSSTDVVPAERTPEFTHPRIVDDVADRQRALLGRPL
jgi:hypothetical protein